jgi:hypothetical protein
MFLSIVILFTLPIPACSLIYMHIFPQFEEVECWQWISPIECKSSGGQHGNV